MSLPFASGAGGTSRPFSARFPGICEDCQEGFEVGEMIMYSGNDLVHGDPDECAASERPARTAKSCDKCYLVHAGDCF